MEEAKVANPKELRILKRGLEAWSLWRQAHPTIQPNLEGADLTGSDLRAVDLSKANLKAAKLHDADLRVADLRNAEFSNSDLSWVDLRATDLTRANLRGANLSEADLSEAEIGQTTFGNVDLSTVKGLETVRHTNPSTLGIDSILLSHGKIPEIFLRGVGVPEPFIVNMKSLIAAMSPMEFYSCFISYSSKDQEFAERLYADLQAKGVRCWFAPEDIKIGDRIRQRIDDAIRLHDKLLVVLSKTSVSSTWVEKEVETAFEKEQRDPENKTALFPIRLDEAVMETGKAWAADIRCTRHMGDFSQWQDHNAYKKAFERLLRDLQGEKTKDAKPSKAP